MPSLLRFASGHRTLFAAVCLATFTSGCTAAQLERQIVADLNDLRSNPARWGRHLEERRKWYRGNLLRRPGMTPIRTREGVRAVDEAIAELAKLHPLPPLSFSAGLANAARDHVRDIGPRGLVTHTGLDRSSARDRVGRYLPNIPTLGEAISFGPSDARSVIADLIVDDGVAGRGHRRILLDPAYRLAGAACGPHKTYGTVCIIDLASDR